MGIGMKFDNFAVLLLITEQITLKHTTLNNNKALNIRYMLHTLKKSLQDTDNILS